MMAPVEQLLRREISAPHAAQRSTVETVPKTDGSANEQSIELPAIRDTASSSSSQRSIVNQWEVGREHTAVTV